MALAWLVRVDDVVKELTEVGDEVTAELLREQLQKLPCYCLGCLEKRSLEREDDPDELPF